MLSLQAFLQADQRKRFLMATQQVCTGKFTLQRSFSILVSVVWVVFPLLTEQLRKWRHMFKELPNIKRVWSLALDITGRP